MGFYPQNDSNGSDDESEQSEEYVPSDGDSGGEEYEEEDSDEDYSSVSEGSESGMWQLEVGVAIVN